MGASREPQDKRHLSCHSTLSFISLHLFYSKCHQKRERRERREATTTTSGAFSPSLAPAPLAPCPCSTANVHRAEKEKEFDSKFATPDNESSQGGGGGAFDALDDDEEGGGGLMVSVGPSGASVRSEAPRVTSCPDLADK